MKEMRECGWLQQWTDVAKRFAFQYNPALQPRAIIVYGCISKQVTDSEIKQLLRILVKVNICLLLISLYIITFRKSDINLKSLK